MPKSLMLKKQGQMKYFVVHWDQNLSQLPQVMRVSQQHSTFPRLERRWRRNAHSEDKTNNINKKCISASAIFAIMKIDAKWAFRIKIPTAKLICAVSALIKNAINEIYGTKGMRPINSRKTIGERSWQNFISQTFPSPKPI